VQNAGEKVRIPGPLQVRREEIPSAKPPGCNPFQENAEKMQICRGICRQRKCREMRPEKAVRGRWSQAERKKKRNVYLPGAARPREWKIPERKRNPSQKRRGMQDEEMNKKEIPREKLQKRT